MADYVVDRLFTPQPIAPDLDPEHFWGVFKFENDRDYEPTLVSTHPTEEDALKRRDALKAG